MRPFTSVPSREVTLTNKRSIQKGQLDTVQAEASTIFNLSQPKQSLQKNDSLNIIMSLLGTIWLCARSGFVRIDCIRFVSPPFRLLLWFVGPTWSQPPQQACHRRRTCTSTPFCYWEVLSVFETRHGTTREAPVSVCFSSLPVPLEGGGF